MSKGKLRNHIAPGAPATREPCEGSESPMGVSLGFSPRWYLPRLGIDFSEPRYTDPHFRFDALTKMKSHLHECFPEVLYFVPGGDLERIRKLFPDTRRAVIYSPVRLTEKSESEIAWDLEDIARKYAPCDIVLADVDSNTTDVRVRAFPKTCRELETNTRRDK